MLSSLVVSFFKVPLQAPHSLYVICAESSGNSRDVCCLQFQSLFWVQVILLKYLYQIDIKACENFLTNSSSPWWQLDQSGQRWDISKFSNSKMSSDMEVAPRYPLLTLLTVFTLFILFKLLYTAKTLACMSNCLYTCRERLERYWKWMLSCWVKSGRGWIELREMDLESP